MLKSAWAPWLVIGAVVLFGFTRWYIFDQLGVMATDVDHYYGYAAQAVDLGETPYTQDGIEYPPAAWWLLRGVRNLNGPPLAAPIDAQKIEDGRRRYTVTFRTVMLLADLCASALFWIILRMESPRFVGVGLLTYVIATALLGHLLYDRLDTGLLLLILLWVYCSMRRWRSKHNPVPWLIAAYAMLGAAVAFKLIPIYILPIVLAAEYVRPKDHRHPLAASAAFLLPCAFPFVVEYAQSGPASLGFITFHAGRGVGIEALSGTFMAALWTLGSSMDIVTSHGAFDLVGPAAPLLKGASVASLILLELFLVVWTFRNAPQDERAGLRAALIGLVAAVIGSNVVSPQYMIWALPLILLVIAGDESLQAELWIPVVVVAVAGFTTLVFPYNFVDPATGAKFGLLSTNGRTQMVSPWPVVLLGCRNVLYLAIVIRLVRSLSGWLRNRETASAAKKPKGRAAKNQTRRRPADAHQARIIVPAAIAPTSL